MIYSVVRETWLTRKPSINGFIAAAVGVLLLAIASVIYWTNFRGFAPYMPAVQDEIFVHGQWWRVFTAMFAHADPGHLLSNLLLFFVLGAFLGGFFGAVRMSVNAFLWGGLTNFLTVLSMEPDARLVGASGVVFWYGGAWLVLYLLLDTKRLFYQRALRAIGVGLVLFMPSEAFDRSISYRAHLIGFGLGLLWGLLHYWRYHRRYKAAEVIETIVETEEDFALAREVNLLNKEDADEGVSKSIG